MRSGASWTSCSSTSSPGEGVAGPAARRPAFRSSKPKPKPKQRLPDTLGGGGCGWAGHAVNPSMGLDGAIHGANGPARPCPPPLDTFLRARCVHARCLAFCRCQPWLATALTLLFLLTLNFRSRSARAGNCREGTGDAGRTVGAMDGAIEPTGTYLRRVLPAPPVPLAAINAGAANNAVNLLRILPAAVGILPRPQFDRRQQRRRRRDAAQRQGHGATNTQRLEVGPE